MTVSFWQQRRRRAPATYDVAVVGGGLVGVATAYWLRQLRPGWRVALVEAHTLGHGASGRNAGFLLQGSAHDFATDAAAHGARTARRLWTFTRLNRDLVASELSTDAVAFEGQGSLTVAGTPEEDARLQGALAQMRGAGAPVVYCTPEETNHRLSATGFGGSLFVTSGAAVDPLGLVGHVAERSGADVLEHHPVDGLDAVGDHVALETPARRIEAGRVVLALGAYLPRLVPALGRYVRPVRAQMLATEPAAARVLALPAYTHRGYFYVRQTARGHVLVGGARHRHRAAEVGYRDATTPALQADLERYLRRYFPWTRGLAVTMRWSGTMGFSPDGRPVVGTVPGLEERGLWAAGFTGHGMSYGFHMGRLLARLACGGQPAAYDLFAADRFDAAPATAPSPAAR